MFPISNGMRKNILITLVVVVLLGAGALVWVWNSEMGEQIVTKNAPVPESTSTSPIVDSNVSISTELDDLQVEDPNLDFEEVDEMAKTL